MKAYTYSNAYATFDENKLGTLKEGKFADFVILSQDPRKVGANKIPEIKVLSTNVNGKQVSLANKINYNRDSWYSLIVN